MEVILIGKQLLGIAPVVNVISGSAKSIYGLLDSISKSAIGSNYTDVDVNDFIDTLDISNKLEIYSLLIMEFPGTNSQAITNSLVGVKNIIVDIELQLKEIKRKIDYNKKLWMLKGWRSYNITKDLKSLEKLIKKLDGRIQSLRIVTEISKLWNNSFNDIYNGKYLTNTTSNDDDQNLAIQKY
jgi:hypothetical protein